MVFSASWRSLKAASHEATGWSGQVATHTQNSADRASPRSGWLSSQSATGCTGFTEKRISATLVRVWMWTHLSQRCAQSRLEDSAQQRLIDTTQFYNQNSGRAFTVIYCTFIPSALAIFTTCSSWGRGRNVKLLCQFKWFCSFQREHSYQLCRDFIFQLEICYPSFLVAAQCLLYKMSLSSSPKAQTEDINVDAPIELDSKRAILNAKLVWINSSYIVTKKCNCKFSHYWKR